MGDPRWRTIDEVVDAYRRHLERTRGACAVTRRNYGKYVGAFLDGVFGDGPVDLGRLSAPDVIHYVMSLAGRYQPDTIGAAATALRGFFRFLRVHGVRDDRLDDAVPFVASPRLAGLPRHMDAEDLERLVASVECSKPWQMRRRAIVLCIARLGLRTGEVAGLLLDDIDWRNAVLHVRARKTGHGARLPLPRDVGRALVEYLRKGRPRTDARHIFVSRHRPRVGEPIAPHTVTMVVRCALDRAGVDARVRGTNLLRHTLATRLIRGGSSLKEVADLMGHRSLMTTQIYAKLDLPSLRTVAQPWPEEVLS
jgi:site-specific recombinase XerD